MHIAGSLGIMFGRVRQEPTCRIFFRPIFKMKWELSVPSSVATTVLVLLLDVIALWCLDFALRRVAAYLNARAVYDAHNAVNISDVWFERISGHDHGPMWFRTFQASLKLVLRACSILVGLSIDGFSQPLDGQTVLEHRVRCMAQVGIGGFNNFSTYVLFVKNAYLCGYVDFNDTNGVVTHIIWNARGREPISSSQYRPAGRVSLEWLSEKNNFAVPPVRYRVVNRSNALSSRPCIKSVPSLLQIQMGQFNVTMAPCPWHSPHLEYQAAYLGGCAFTLEKIEDEVLFTWSYNGRSLTRPRGVADDGHVYRFWA